MKFRRITTFPILLFITFVLTLPSFAQDATAEATAPADWQTVTNQNGSASVQFPTGWVSKNANDATSILSVSFANNQSALGKDLFNKNDVFQSGEVHIDVATILLADLVSQMPAGVLTLDATPLELVQALAKQGMPDTFTFGDPGATTINENPAVRMNLMAAKRGEGQLLLTIYDKKWVMALILYAAPGEGDKWDITARDILASIQIAPSAEVTPLPVVDATDEPPADLQTYISTVGNFKVSYPIGWNFEDRSALNHGEVVGGIFASNPEAQHKQLDSDIYISGDIRIEFVLVSFSKLATLPQLAKVDPTTSVTEIMQALVDAKINSESLDYGEVQSAFFKNGTAAQVNLSTSDNNGDGRMLFIKRDDGIMISLLIYTASRELQAGEDAARQIVASLILNEPTEATAESLALTQTAKTANGLGSLSYPDTWLSRPYGSESIYIANSQTALDKSFGSAFDSGEVNILVTVSPTDEYIKQAQLPLTVDASPLELLQMTIKAVGDTMKFGVPQTTTVADKRAASVDFTGQGFEGTAWMIEYQKGAIITVQLLTAPGESSQWQSTILAIIASVKSTD